MPVGGVVFYLAEIIENYMDGVSIQVAIFYST